MGLTIQANVVAKFSVTLALAGVLSVAIAGGAWAGTAAKTESTDGVFDDSSGTRVVTFAAADLPGDPTILDVNVSITFAKHDGQAFLPEGSPVPLGNPFLREIEFVLTSPSGTQFTLISNRFDTELVLADNFGTFTSDSVVGFTGTVLFDQAAAQPVDFSASTITAGTFRPDDSTQNSLDVFNGENGIGNWTLFIEDDVGLDALSFYEFTVTIRAVGTPPTVSCTAARTVLWPATRSLLDVGLAVQASDPLGGGPVAIQVSVFSDEGNGLAPYAPDSSWSGVTLRLRAEREIGGAANGRVYLVVVRGTDVEGDVATACCTVVCPLNLTATHLVALSAEAAAALATCVGTGAPPVGYFGL